MSSASPQPKYRPMAFGVPRVIVREGSSGVRYMRGEPELAEYASTMGERLAHWAKAAPDRTLFARRVTLAKATSALALATGLALAGSGSAHAQAFEGTPTVVSGGVVINRTTGQDNIRVDTNQAVINWTTNDTGIGGGPINFLPNGRTAFFVQLGRFTHFIRRATGKLHRYRLFNRVPFAFLNALPGLTDHRLASDHLRHVKAGAKLTHNFAERHIGHASHWRQYDGTIDFDVTDMDGFKLHLQILPKI